MRSAFHILMVAAWLSAIAAQASAVAAQAIAQPPASSADARPVVLPDLISWRQNLFSIPFRIAPAREEAAQPVEVQLHVSEDQGLTWRMDGRVPPDQGSFTFRAARDGEYWFAIRTVDRQKRLRPEGNPTAELRVRVDTQPPRLDLSVVRADSGEVTARWQIADPNVDPTTLKLEYRTGTDQPWQPVAVDPARGTYNQGAGGGSVTFWPPERSAALTVRAAVSDRAGNPAIAQVNVDAGPGASADRGGPRISSTAVSNERDQWASAVKRPDAGATWPPEQATAVPLGREPLKKTTSPPAMGRSYPDDLSTGRANQGANLRDASGREYQSVAMSPGFARRMSNAHPPAEHSGDNSRPDASAGREFLPAGEEPRRVNSAAFEMEYDVESVGPSGVARVEIWATRDGGRTWTSAGIDPDNRSPMKVAVEGEGVYGFRMVIQSGSGLGGRAPQSGDLPEVWVSVDLTQPTARLIAAELGTGPRAGELQIAWEASDAQLAARPVSLSFAQSQSGPWTTIAAGLENTGSYGWRLDSRVPERVYLRLEVRDEAGNVAIVESTEPVSLEQIRPAGRILNVRPVSAASDQTHRDLWR